MRKRVIIGLPGNNFSDTFLTCWTNLVVDLLASDYEIRICQGYSSFVSFARMKTMGLDVMRGKDQKPFDDAEYDIFLTIDSDMVFSSKLVLRILEKVQEYKVVSGMYMMQGGEMLATVKDWDHEYFLNNGSFKFLTMEDIINWKKENPEQPMMKVAYSGMGMFACTKEVLNSLEYPYFYHPIMEITGSDGKVYRDICSEDVALCRNIQEKGFDIYLDTDVRVGHEKRVII